MRTKKIAIALLTLGTLLASASQALAAPGPAWQISLMPMPTNFKPGTTGSTVGNNQAPRYRLLAANVGGAPTTADPVMTTLTLPPGLTPAPTPPKGDASDASIPEPTCAVSGQTVTCEDPGPVYPGRLLGATIPIEVSSSLIPGEVLSAEASIEGGGATTVTSVSETLIDPVAPHFGFLPGPAGLSSLLTNADASPSTQAGSHPNQLTIDLAFPTEQPGITTRGAGHPRSLQVDLPRGLIVDPLATARCTEAQLISVDESGQSNCPHGSQIGTITVMTELGGPIYATSPLFNMVPPFGVPAEFGFQALNVGIFIHLKGGVRSDGDYGLSATTNDVLALPNNPLLSAKTQLWGDPSGESHDEIRGTCRNGSSIGGVFELCPVERQKTVFLTMPSQCTGPIPTSATATNWEEPGVPRKRSVPSTDLGGTPVGVEGCNQLPFEPTISSQPTTNLADSPSGLDFDLHQPNQVPKLESLSPANLKDATVTLPEGMAVNPSQANGLEACASTQIGLTSAIGASPIHFTKDPESCPDAARIGSVEVTTPLLDHPLPGSLYIAKPFENPFGSLLAIYLSIDDPPSGTIAKLAGKVIPDPVTGQLTTRFTENPELPLEDVRLHLFTGPRASLITPPTCGTHTTTSDLTPWSSPEGADATPFDSFQTTAAPGGGDCPSTEGGASNSPAFIAGTIAPQAGAYSPFVLKLTRPDGSQRLAGIDTTLPPGLTGKLAGIPYCSEAQIAQAQGRNKPNEGALAAQSPSCPASSEVGTVDVAAGAGITPLHVQGHAYLSGPYKGAPLSLAVITPAVAGPFDLGTVVVRVALHLDPETAQIHAVSDPFPQILDGIPLDLRQVALEMGRPQFTLNPTSCDPMSIDGTSTSALGQGAALTSPFQVGGCNALAFKPKLAIRLKGATKRTGHPALIATATFTKGQANTKRVSVTLPRSEFLDQGHIGTVCTRVQFAANQCPKASVYGKARATTPLLDEPLSGPVYLRSSSHELPDLVIALHGQVDVVLDGRVDSINGGIRTTFEAAPDAPVSKFVLEMQGGRKGLLINSANLCKLKPAATRAVVKMDGQNGKVWDTEPVVQSSCKHKRQRRHKQRR